MINKQKSFRWKWIIPILILTFIFYIPARAADTGSLQFHFPKETAGLEITMYKAAEYDLEKFTYTSDFAENPAELLNFSTAAEMQNAADKLESFAISRNLNGTKGTVAADGTLTFTGLSNGLYLIIQTGSDSQYIMQAALVPIPCIIGTGESTNQVDVYPKIESKPQVTTPPEKPDVTPTPPQITEKPDVTPTPPQITEKPDVTPTPPQITEKPNATPTPPEITEKPDATPTPPETTEKPVTPTPPETTNTPNTPNDSDEPNVPGPNNNSPEEPTKSAKDVKTGDDTPAAFYMILFLTAIFTIGMVCRHKKRG